MEQGPERDGASGRKPLTGVRVVEAAAYVSGPFAGLMLAQLGADVVKVEPPTGDPLRRFSLKHEGLSAVFINLNHGKRSIALDLKSDTGKAAMRDLLSDADVFLENWRPGVADALGCGYEETSAVNPRLIHVSITGFGPTGPAASAPVFDMLLQAVSGLSVLESEGGRPIQLRSFIADKTTSAFATQSILAALFERTRTGRGTKIDLAMLDVMAYFNFPDLYRDRTFLDPDAQGDLRAGRSGILATADGYIAVSPMTGRQIASAVTAVGHPEWAGELRTITDPTELTDQLYSRLEQVTPSRTTADWLERFATADVPAAPALTADEHLRDPQTLHNELYIEGASPVGTVRKIRHPAKFDGARLGDDLAPAPVLGNDQLVAGIADAAPEHS